MEPFRGFKKGKNNKSYAKNVDLPQRNIFFNRPVHVHVEHMHFHQQIKNGVRDPYLWKKVLAGFPPSMYFFLQARWGATRTVQRSALSPLVFFRGLPTVNNNFMCSYGAPKTSM